MREELTIKIAGASYGDVLSAGMMLCRLYRNGGRHVFAVRKKSAGPRPGGVFQARVSCRPVYAARDKADIILALEPEASGLGDGTLAEDGLLLSGAGPDTGPRQPGAAPAALGTLSAVCGQAPEAFLPVIAREYAGKGAAETARHERAALRAYEYAAAKISLRFEVRPGPRHDRDFLLNGSEALALGLLAGGCRRFASSRAAGCGGDTDTLAYHAGKAGMRIEAAGNASFEGAAFPENGGASVRIGLLSDKSPVPRGGRETFSGGSLYVPGSPEEAFRVARRAADMARRFRLSSLILADRRLEDSFVNTARPDLADGPAEAREGGRPPETLPGEPLPPTVRAPGAGTMLCGTGSTLGLLKEVCALRPDTGFTHYPQLRPFPAAAARRALRGAGCVLVIGDDPSGRLAELITGETGIAPDGSIVKYGGGAFTLDEALAALKRG